jgi:hypothetical protein
MTPTKPGAVGILLAVALGGCSSIPATTINVNSGGVVQPSIRVGWNLGGAKGAPSDPQAGHGIEIGAMRASTDDTQDLSAGQAPVRFGGVTFVPPQTLRNEVDFAVYDVSYRLRLFSADRAVGLEVLAGLAYASFDLTVSSALQRASDRESSLGVQGGIGVLWRVHPGTTLQLRGSWFGSGEGDGVTTASSVEASAAQALGSNVVVRAGYGYTSAESDRESPDSRISFRFSGPLLRLELQF